MSIHSELMTMLGTPNLMAIHGETVTVGGSDFSMKIIRQELTDDAEAGGLERNRMATILCSASDHVPEIGNVYTFDSTDWIATGEIVGPNAGVYRFTVRNQETRTAGRESYYGA